MERKYYLRGLGLGIAMTAIIMGVALPDSRAMTNDEIIARAKELGMVENTVLSDPGDTDGSQDIEVDGRFDVQDAPDQTQDDLAAAGPVIDTDPEDEDAAVKEDEDASESEGEISPEVDKTGQEGADPENTVGEEDPEPEEATEEEQENTTIHEENSSEEETVNEVITSTAVKTITINSGDGSYTVAKKLADAGVITSAQNFDDFLCQNGYDKRLRTGSFSIPSDASDEQIARIVTGME